MVVMTGNISPFARKCNRDNLKEFQSIRAIEPEPAAVSIRRERAR
jgi:hypothetical protein